MTQPTILVVDDRADNRAVFQAVIQEFIPGVRVLCAPDAAAALRLVAAGAPDIVLSDVQMPDLGGVDLCRRLKADPATAFVPVLLITARDAPVAERAAALEAGAYDFLARPIENTELVARLRAALRIKAAEDELRRARDAAHLRADQSEERYRILFDNARDAVFVHAPDGRGTSPFTDVNEVACRSLGYTRAELLRLCPADIEAPGWSDARLQAARRIAKDGEWLFEMELLAKDGRRIPVEISARRFQMGAGTFVQSIARDISERKAVERNLQENRALLRSYFDNLPALFFVKNLRGEITMVNRTFTAAFGLSEDQILGRTDHDFHPPDEADAIIANDRIVAQTGRTLEFEEPTPLPDGVHLFLSTKFPIRNATGEIVATGGVSFDITARKRAEEALRASEAYLSRIINTISDPVFVKDDQSRLVLVNEAFCVIFGLSQDRVLGRTLAEDVSEEQRAHFLRVDRQVLADGLEDIREEQLTVRDGPPRTIITKKSRYVDPGGKRFIVGVIHDITDRLLLEERLRQADKLTAIGQLAGGVAHDFNNQLAGILGCADILLDRLTDENLRRFAENIRTAAWRGATLTKQLLAFSRKGKYLSVPVDIHKIVAEVVALLEHTIDKRIAIRQFLSPGPHIVRGDPTQLQNALLNLAVNARDAMPEGGTLTFATEAVRLGADPEVAAGTYLRIRVVDTGGGITPENRRRLFEPFFTTKPLGKGTGLGLAAVHGTVHNHHGRIEVESEPGKGSTFAVLLPVLEDQETDIPASAPTVKIGPARILVVDDEPVCRDTMADQLRDLGHEVEACADGQAAIDRYQDSWERLDLVLLDMIMPGLGGRDTFRALRRINPRTRVLLVSGHSLEGEAQALLDEGVLGFVQKPFDRAGLSRAVAEALGRKA